jgi:hypothetical protein
MKDVGGFQHARLMKETNFDIGCRAARLLAKSDIGIENNVVIVSRQVAFGYHRHIF